MALRDPAVSLVLDSLGLARREAEAQERLQWPGALRVDASLPNLPLAQRLRVVSRDRVVAALAAEPAVAEHLGALHLEDPGDVLEAEDLVPPAEATQLQRAAASKNAMGFTKGNMGAGGQIFTPGGSETPAAEDAPSTRTPAPAPEMAAKALAPVLALLAPDGSFRENAAIPRTLQTLPPGDFYTGDKAAMEERLRGPAPRAPVWISAPSAAQAELLAAAPQAAQVAEVEMAEVETQGKDASETKAATSEADPQDAAAERRWERQGIRLEYGLDDEEDAAVFAEALTAAKAILPEVDPALADALADAAADVPSEAPPEAAEAESAPSEEAPARPGTESFTLEDSGVDAALEELLLEDPVEETPVQDSPDSAGAPNAEDAVLPNIDDLLQRRAPAKAASRTLTPTLPSVAASRAAKPPASWAVTPAPLPADFRRLVPHPALTYPFELDDFQKQAVLRLEQKEDVFVAAHTSAGKTVVAEYSIALALRHATRVVYTSPIKALSNQKYRDFREKFGVDNVGIVTGDVSVNPEAPCVIMTTEILRSMLYRGADLVRDLEWVVFDEVHYVNDSERGVVWEEVIIMLPSYVGMVFLSATTPNTIEFCEWIGRTKRRPVYVITTQYRPVPLRHHLVVKNRDFPILDAQKHFLVEGVEDAGKCLRAKEVKKAKAIAAGPKAERERGIQRGGAGRGAGARPTGRGTPGVKPSFGTRTQPGRSGGSRSEWIALVQRLHSSAQTPAVVFSFSKKKCDETANFLSGTDLNTGREAAQVKGFCLQSLKKLSPKDRQLPQVLQVCNLVERGVGVHHGGLLPILKEVVEMLFGRGLVKVLFATETFAMGVNMPAKTVVFNGTRKHDGRHFRDLLPGEYTQMAGRAGRRGLDPVGNVLICVWEEVSPMASLKAMLTGPPTKLESRFRLRYAMILSLLRVEDLSVEDMIRRSFSEFATQRALGARNLPLLVKEGREAADHLVEAAGTRPCIRGVEGGDHGEDGRAVGSWAALSGEVGLMYQRVLEHALRGGRSGVLVPGRVIVAGFPAGLPGTEPLAQAVGVVLCLPRPGVAEGLTTVLVAVALPEGWRLSREGFRRGLKVRSQAASRQAREALGFGGLMEVASKRDDMDDLSFSRKKKGKKKGGRGGAGGGDGGGGGAGEECKASAEAAPEAFDEALMPQTGNVQAAATENFWAVGTRGIAVVEIPLVYLRVVTQEKCKTFDAPSLVCAPESAAHNAATPEAAQPIALAAAEDLMALLEPFAPEMLDPMDLARMLKIQDIDTLEACNHLKGLHEELRFHKCAGCEALGSQFAVGSRRLRVGARLARLTSLASNESLSLFPDFKARLRVLKRLGYVDAATETVTLKGKVACEVATCDEILLSELVLENILEPLTAEEVAAVLSALIYQERKDSADPSIRSSGLQEACRAMKALAKHLGDVQRDCGLPTDGNTFADESLNFGLVDVVHEWARGVPFVAITQLTLAQEGSIVRAITRLDELLREVRNCARVVGNPGLYQKMLDASTAVKRDVVFAGSLYI